MLGQFLLLKKDQEKFVEYLRKEIGVANHYSIAAYKCLYEWSLNFIWINNNNNDNNNVYSFSRKKCMKINRKINFNLVQTIYYFRNKIKIKLYLKLNNFVLYLFLMKLNRLSLI